MKLIGSTTSPFVRKVQLLLADEEYEFEQIKALTPEGAKKLNSYVPSRRIPVLIVDGKTIFDSTIISEYLLEKKSIRLSIDEKLTLRLIDELCDSCILLFQHKFWDIDSNWENEVSKRMYGRSLAILKTLDQMISVDQLTELQKDWLYCVLDWLRLRSVINWQRDHQNLLSFFDSAKNLDKYQSTKLPE